MIQVVVNRFSQSNVINPQMIQKNLGKNPYFAIPDEPATCESALAKSQPFTIASPGAAVSRSYSDLVRRMESSRMLDQLSKLNKPTGVAQKLQVIQGGGGAESVSAGEGNAALLSRSKVGSLDPWTNMKLRIHRGLIDVVDMKKMNADVSDPKQREVMREKTQKAILDILGKEDISTLCPTRELRAQLVKEVLDEALGLGPLEDLLADDSVTEIMVNARDQIYVEQAGKPGLSKVTFSSEQQMMNVVERIVTPLGRRVDEKTPYVDARLADGSRVHIIIPPLALRGPTITIRKFPKKRITPADLVKYGSMTTEIADFLRACVEAKLNIVVSGGTGSGKTTLLNVLSNFIPATERIITVEDAAELQLGQEHLVRLETRPKNIEGEGEVSIRDLIKCCLRMRPDRIVVGECRGGEALDMLQAMNTGHSGSLTTVHANNPREAISRMENMIAMGNLNIPSQAVREQIASAVNCIIQVQRLRDGSRKVTHVSEITGMEGDVVTMQDLFVLEILGEDDKGKLVTKLKSTGLRPKFFDQARAFGVENFVLDAMAEAYG
jgi:septum site-determining protein MinD